MIREWNRDNGDMATRGEPFLTGKEATAAGIYHRLRLFFGEFWLDVTEGTAWFQSILGKAPQDLAELTLKQRILTAPGVVSITSFSFTTDAASRRITVDATVLDVNHESIRILFDEGFL
ncbi:hypothetical protein EKK97_14070 [Billgrantia tianxiuensis]|uniref:Uncharacterized protein n=1 Tax=Billgrantia tianxiuensis TaxID=2497861 RepID=A0A6I6SMP1_9GAMM|nr:MULTISPECIES: hypothetical protein [Halomonas]MCE8034625.1 hypothetical protein [Halomonas sp. MCCC 1A11057]QHC50491.1 hypothetical protein EKK97_14070 [Halomonas tianxiuensis]